MLNHRRNVLHVIAKVAQTLKWGVVFGVLLVSTAAATTNAAPVVVGSVNPITNRVNIFEDLMVKTFADGGQIQHFLGGYGSVSKAYFLMRAGKTATGGCRTEFFRLVRLENNRLAIADPDNFAAPWNPHILQKMFATFDCTSTDCLFCESGNPNDPMGADPNSGCACTDGGSCQKVAPGSLSYGPQQIVTPF